LGASHSGPQTLQSRTGSREHERPNAR
jgi:hypothetical protein